jgi:hypothetical protein
MGSSKNLTRITGWLVFAIALTVYFFSAERTGSLWDCGEFILGAYKLQVVHPPGAPLFLLVGRLFAWVGSFFSSDPANIAFAVNLMSSTCTAFAAAFIAWTCMDLTKLSFVGRDGQMDQGQSWATAGAGLVAGLTTAFCTSIWFSAVEGEVYAMSTFFTTLTLWSTVKWYSLPDNPNNDRWLLFTVYAGGLSIGVHLLSLLTFPALGLFYYFKKYKQHNFLGMALAAGGGVVVLGVIQKLIIVGIPVMWSKFELLMVNGMGLPFHSGLVPTILIVSGAIVFGLNYAHKKGNQLLQLIVMAAALVVISFSTLGVVVVRANASTPVNMNAPSDAMRLIPYLNREQYGERALLYGPNFSARYTDLDDSEDRYGRVGNRYEIVDQKISLEYSSKDKKLFPRMGDGSQGRPRLYKRWMGLNPDGPLPANRPNFADNIGFFVRYQLGWMYWRYFMWNFSGRQNGDQGYEPWDKSSGHWISGIGFLDSMRLGDQSELPATERDNKARNTYFMIPFLFGLIGMFFHFKKRNNEALALMALFIITGIGIIVYSNQPPREPRERDYVLVGSFFTYAIWVGMAVASLFNLLRERAKQSGPVAAIVASLAVLSAPLLMGFQNYDDQSRMHHTGSRDYASNFLNSCAPNAIIFTYGDNDTYPLWYAQEVENIRRDVRVVNLSLIAVDWYIDLLRRKQNESPALKLTIPSEAYRGNKRNQVLYNPYAQSSNANKAASLDQFLRMIAQPREVPLQGGRKLEGFYETKNVFIPVDRQAALASGAVTLADSNKIVSRIPLNLTNKDQMLKDEIAILDVIGSNLWERPIYFSVTCRREKLMGLDNYMQLEGLGLRIVPVRSEGENIYGMIGLGRVNKDAYYENVMEKFRWGNFDKEDLFVDNSYMPSIQSLQLGMRRVSFELLRDGDKDKAMALVDRYFESFPHKNFPYDYRTMMMLDVLYQANEYQKAKPHMEILASETLDYLEYYSSIIDNKNFQASFGDQYSLRNRDMERLLEEAQRQNDTEFMEKWGPLFAPYRASTTPNQGLDGLQQINQ